MSGIFEPGRTGGRLAAGQIEQLVRWRERGWSYRAIACRLGVSPGAVLYQCLRHGAISPKQRGREAYTGPSSFTGRDGIERRRFSADEDAAIQALEGQGLGYQEIARRVGRAYTSVRIRLMTLAMHDEIAS